MRLRWTSLALLLAALGLGACGGSKPTAPAGTGGAAVSGSGGGAIPGGGGSAGTGAGGGGATGTGGRALPGTGGAGAPATGGTAGTSSAAGGAGGGAGGNGSAGAGAMGGNGGVGTCPATGAAGSAATGCDLGAAQRALAALGLTTVCPLASSTTTLPAMLTDANWGLKAEVCRDGGYDLTPLAGQTVCLVTQGITQLCQEMPASVFVVMHDGAVACIYKVLRPGSRIAPGVYSTVDPLCHL